MNITSLFRTPKLSVISAAAVFYVLTFSLAGVLAPSNAHAAGSSQVVHQVAQ